MKAVFDKHIVDKYLVRVKRTEAKGITKINDNESAICFDLQEVL